MISLRGLTLQRGVKRLLEDASLVVHPGQKIGIIGANGAGKSSLFKLLMGELQPEAGDVSVPAVWRVAQVEQEIVALARPALDFAIDGDEELRSVEAAVARAEHDGDGIAAAEAHARLAEIGGHSAIARAAGLLDGLGFSQDDHARPVSDFSGGWRVRLQLARALMARSDLLLLDEPTNHLDLDAVFWLERWLGSYDGTLLVISHDREFLDNVVRAVVHFDGQKLRLYTGSFSDFERARAEAFSQQTALRARQEREIARLESFVTRFRAKATKARQAQSRMKAIDRIQLVARAQVDEPFTFEFANPELAADPLLKLDEAQAAYGDRTVLRNVDFILRPGARVGLLGRNGAGKSTLMKLLAGRLTPAHGERLEGRGLRIGYFAQHQLDQLRPEDSPLRHLQRMDARAREQDLRTFLGGFGFGGDEAGQAIGPLSGGEKARLALALIIYAKPHLLLLDEPTNHLDLGMRGALTLALQAYGGALVLVSHDRSLLKSAVDEFWLVADGEVAPFDGDLDDYRDWLSRQGSSPRSADSAVPAPTLNRKDQRRFEAEQRAQAAAQRKPLANQIAQAEREIARLEAVKQDLESQLANPDLYGADRKDDLTRLLRKQGENAARLATLEANWLELQSRLEGLETTASG